MNPAIVVEPFPIEMTDGSTWFGRKVGVRGADGRWSDSPAPRVFFTEKEAAMQAGALSAVLGLPVRNAAATASDSGETVQ